MFFFQAEDGIRDLVRSRGLGDVYKRQARRISSYCLPRNLRKKSQAEVNELAAAGLSMVYVCLFYTSDAADERSSVDLGGCRIIKKKTDYAVRS